MTECNTEEIVKQIRILDTLKELKANMGDNLFSETFPELNTLSSRLDSIIEQMDTELQGKMDECGNLQARDILTEKEL